MKRLPPILAAAAATLAALAGTAPAQAARIPAWRVVFTHHYGPKTNLSSYTAAVALGTRGAWAFGTTNGAGLPAPGVPVAERWNGLKWRASALPRGLKSEVVAASAASPRSVWAVTEIGDILRWNGARWRVSKRVAGGGLFTAVAAVSPRDVWAFGASPAGPGAGAWHFNGRAWSQVSGVASMISYASAVSANDIWAVTAAPNQSILRFNGSTWQTMTGLPGTSVGSILALSRTDVWATTDSPAAFAQLRGTKWTVVTTPWKFTYLGRLVPDGRGGLWAVGVVVNAKGQRSWVLHRSARGRWSRFAATANPPLALARIPGSSGLWGVGATATKSGANAAIWAHGRV